jgi:hypothetical protein
MRPSDLKPGALFTFVSRAKDIKPMPFLCRVIDRDTFHAAGTLGPHFKFRPGDRVKIIREKAAA